MGLDMYIDKCRKPCIIDGKREYEEREEVCHWEGFLTLLREGLPFKYGNEKYGQDIQLSKDNVEQILNYVTHNRDYFGGFSSVEQVCKLLDEYDYLTKKEDYVICFNANW